MSDDGMSGHGVSHDGEADPRRTVTHAPETVHNPQDIKHFMRIKPVAGRVRIRRGDDLLAESRDALRLLEIGRDFYDPIFYLPRADVIAALISSEKTTRCPLKGETRYFSLTGGQGADIAWSYVGVIPGVEPIKDRIAFDPSRVTVEEGPDGP